jgi:hypothetical protein
MGNLSGIELAEIIAHELSYMTFEERAECLGNLERRAKAQGNFNALRAIDIYKRTLLNDFGSDEIDR